MRIIYRGDLSQVHLAVEDANDILNSNSFYEAISQYRNFNCTKMSPSQIAEIIKDSTLEVEAEDYRPRWPYSKVLGYFTKKKPNNIFLNRRKLYRNTESISNTIIHEYVHAVDNDFDDTIIDFGHNCGTFKSTAPYVIGKIAEAIIDGGLDESLKDRIQALIDEEVVEDFHIDTEMEFEDHRVYRA